MQDRSIHQGFRFIALVYLGIGLYVLLRRWTAPHSTHFYIFCLVSFVLYSFWTTGKFNEFDWIVYWSKIGANALQPALFLHFALAFSSEHRERRRWLVPLIYLPAAAIIALQVMAIELWSATELLRHRLDQVATGHQALFYVLAAAGLLRALPRDQSSARTPAAQVAHPRHPARRRSLHAALGHSLHGRHRHARCPHQNRRHLHGHSSHSPSAGPSCATA